MLSKCLNFLLFCLVLIADSANNRQSTYLFVYGLFKNAVSDSDYTESGVKITRK